MTDQHELMPEHRSELRRAGRLLETASGFRLVIVEFNDHQFRKTIISEINNYGVRAVVLELNRNDFPNFIDFMVKITELSKTYNVIHVIDLDLWLGKDEGDMLLLGFNYYREGIARKCLASLFLWMTELGIYSFMTTAPDMWSWRSAVLTFVIEKSPDGFFADKGCDYMKSMPVDRRLARVKELETFLSNPPSDLGKGLKSELYRELGGLYLYIGTKEGLDKGMACCKRALIADMTLYGPEHPYIAKDYDNIGLAWSILGEPRKALEYLEKALKISLTIYGENHPSVSAGYNNVGITLDKLGKSREALEYLGKALDIDLSVYGDKHPIVANRYSNIGLAWNRLGDSKKALEYLKKALSIDLSAYGENHPNIAVDYNNVGRVSSSLGEPREALEYLEKALKINLAAYGENHPSVARTYNRIGLVWDDLGESRKALEYYAKAVEIDLSTYGENHPDVAVDYGNIGLTWKHIGEFDKALEYLNKALKISLRFYDNNHPQIRKIQENIDLLQNSQSQ